MTYIINYLNITAKSEVEHYAKIEKFVNKSKFNFMICCAVWAFITPFVGGFVSICGIEAFEFTEELMKALSLAISGSFAFMATLIFAIAELFEYVYEYGARYDEIGYFWNFVAYRILCIGDHLVYLGIHAMGNKIARTKESIITRIQIRIIAFHIVWGYHMIHNKWTGSWIIENIFGVV